MDVVSCIFCLGEKFVNIILCVVLYFDRFDKKIVGVLFKFLYEDKLICFW